MVFNTAMTGYQEILTDPSYAQQIVTLTYPHIGNTGTTPQDAESTRVWAAGLIIRDLPLLASNWRSKQSLPDYLRENGCVVYLRIMYAIRSYYAGFQYLQSAHPVASRDRLNSRPIE